MPKTTGPSPQQQQQQQQQQQPNPAIPSGQGERSKKRGHVFALFFLVIFNLCYSGHSSLRKLRLSLLADTSTNTNANANAKQLEFSWNAVKQLLGSVSSISSRSPTEKGVGNLTVDISSLPVTQQKKHKDELSSVSSRNSTVAAAKVEPAATTNKPAASSMNTNAATEAALVATGKEPIITAENPASPNCSNTTNGSKTPATAATIQSSSHNSLTTTITTVHNNSTNNNYQHDNNNHTQSHTDKARVCLIIKDGEPYLREWLDYNLLALGFSDIHILDNSENFTLQHWTYHRSSILLEHFPPPRDNKEKSHQQIKGYKHCIERAQRDNIRWLATFDVDEFLVLHQHANVVDFMHDKCTGRCGQVSINWIVFGTQNRTRYVDAPVTLRFQYGVYWGTVKTIVDTNAVDLHNFYWSHTVTLLPRRKWLDPNGLVVRNKGWRVMVNKNGKTDIAALHHYKYLSQEEWHVKNCVRGDVMGKVGETKKMCNSDKVPPPHRVETFNDDAWQFLCSRVPEYERYESWPSTALGRRR